MASPDRLDQPLALVRPAHWLFLAIGGAIILFALGWGALARVPVKVAGEGVLVAPAGLTEISSQYAGRVAEVLVRPGDRVAAGDVVARLRRDGNDRAVLAARAELEAALAAAALSERSFRAIEAGLARSESALAASLSERIEETRRQLAAREETLANLERLVAQNAATREELNGVAALRDDLKAELRRLRQERADVALAAARRGAERGLERQREEETVMARRRALDLLAAQSDEEALVLAPMAGEVLELRANPGDVIGAGEVLAAIGALAARREGDAALEAVIFAPPAAGKRITPGMAVEVTPSTAERAIYGHIRGTVVTVAPYPASREAMVRVLQNERLADDLAAAGAPIELRVRLERDPSGTPGFAWSSSQGPSFAITRGTLVDAEIVLERRAFLSVLLPGIFGRRR